MMSRNLSGITKIPTFRITNSKLLWLPEQQEQQQQENEKNCVRFLIVNKDNEIAIIHCAAMQ